MPVTINNGMAMPAWYDILEPSIDKKVDEKQLLVSAQAIAALIDKEISRGIESTRIIIAGFSQGGAVGYQTALTYTKPLAGLIAMSTYFATSACIVLSEENKSLPVQIYHRRMDPVVPESLGKTAHDTLKAWGYSTSYETYVMQHSVCAEEINDISRWIQKILL